ncbi:mechanosensitive ion channel family protein [Elongatibacter sediminis]|uniref:Small-conductance mechanosensitive channel n=1 Tax=Elongatibacter sediminis TaxID=3119006 RepID=A0AAW9RFL9_9GAMM
MDSVKEYLLSEELLPQLTDWVINLVFAIVIYLVGKWIAAMLVRWLERLMKSREVDETLVAFLTNLLYAILLTAVILAALDQLGLPVTSLVAVVGAAGLAIGLAMKDSLGNFASGIMLVLFRPFSKGDFIEAAGVSGTVEEVRIFNTVLVTPDNKQVVIPNGQVAADPIVNYSAKDERRVDMEFGVGYEDDLKTAREVLERICRDHALVLDEPATKIFVKSLGDSSVNFAVRPWVKTADYWTVWGDLLETGKVELEAAGCSIPFPQRDVHLFQSDTGSDSN